MLCIPITNDQPGVAQRVKWLGAGEVLLPHKVTAERVRRLVEKLLSERGYRAAAESCRDRLAGNPGVGRAADIVEKSLLTGKRVDR
jgi:UDP:flavonoid glycosyltransferase YjiC (YdhE family)